MSSWPNLTFDMCGMLCGYYKLTINTYSSGITKQMFSFYITYSVHRTQGYNIT